MNTSRPNSVKLAICCLVISFAVASVQMLLKIRFETTSSFIENVFGFLIGWFLVFMIYQRKNWARWIFTGFVVVWLTVLVVHIQLLAEITATRGIILALHLVLCKIAGCMLFVRTSNDWFRTHKESA
jgi:hypothetical protein